MLLGNTYYNLHRVCLHQCHDGWSVSAGSKNFAIHKVLVGNYTIDRLYSSIGDFLLAFTPRRTAFHPEHETPSINNHVLCCLSALPNKTGIIEMPSVFTGAFTPVSSLKVGIISGSQRCGRIFARLQLVPATQAIIDTRIPPS